MIEISHHFDPCVPVSKDLVTFVGDLNGDFWTFGRASYNCDDESFLVGGWATWNILVKLDPLPTVWGDKKLWNHHLVF